MKRRTNLNVQAIVFAAIAGLVLIFGGNLTANAQGKHKPGDRVECNTVGSLDARYEKYFEKGTVMEFRPNDQPDGSWYRVKADSNKVEYYCRVEHIRPITGGATKTATKPTKTTKPAEPVREPEEEETGDTDGYDFVDCPVAQRQARNGARPAVELVKKIIRCAKGEKAVEAGDEGAVTVEISAVTIGTARPFSYSQDMGNAKPGTIVHPVRATYTITTHYRTATEVEEGWIRIFNFYVNAFGEWAIGSQENVKSPKVRRIQR